MSEEPDVAADRRFPWRWAAVAFATVLLGAGVFAASQGQRRAAAPAAPLSVEVKSEPLTQTVSMSGSTAVGTQARLSFGVSGKLAELKVKVGDLVEAGQMIAKLDTRDFELAVLQQRAALASSQANLKRVAAGPADSEIANGANVLASAEAQLTKAQGDLAKLITPPSADDVGRVAADLEKARVELQNAQTAYDLVAWRGDAGSTPQAVALQRATADYNAALSAYNLKVAPPKDADVQTARASTVSASQGVDSARTKLNELLAGAKQDDVAVQRALVDQAAAGLAVAELNLTKATLFAPFGGRISSVTAQPGESVSGAFITLMDMQSIRVEGVVDEQDAPKLKIGQEVEITVNSLPGVIYQGKVQSIAPAALVQQGVSTYAIVISVNTRGEELLAGLSVATVISTQSRESALVVPASMIQLLGGKRFVRVFDANGASSDREIRTGISDGINTEVVAGLQVGERVGFPSTVVLPTPTPAGPGPLRGTSK